MTVQNKTEPNGCGGRSKQKNDWVWKWVGSKLGLWGKNLGKKISQYIEDIWKTAHES